MNTYTYKLIEFPNNKVDTPTLIEEIQTSSIVPGIYNVRVDIRGCNITFKATLSAEEKSTLNQIISTHTGEQKVERDYPVDPSGKLRVHQTSRILGTTVHWTGIGDDVSSFSNGLGTGEPIYIWHAIGDDADQSIYIDFNVIENPSYIHEGLFSWKDAFFDQLTVEVVPKTVEYTSSSNTNYNQYGPIVIPAAGDGNINITSDLTDPFGGLVYLPNGDMGEPPNGFWDADWNSDTKLFENITPNLNQEGRYNIFVQEIPLVRIINHIPLLGSGFQILNSSDTDEIGQNMRLKVTATTNTSMHMGDHAWGLACTLVMHRKETV